MALQLRIWLGLDSRKGALATHGCAKLVRGIEVRCRKMGRLTHEARQRIAQYLSIMNPLGDDCTHIAE